MWVTLYKKVTKFSFWPILKIKFEGNILKILIQVIFKNSEYFMRNNSNVTNFVKQIRDRKYVMPQGLEILGYSLTRYFQGYKEGIRNSVFPK